MLQKYFIVAMCAFLLHHFKRHKNVCFFLFVVLRLISGLSANRPDIKFPISLFFLDFIYLFLERGDGREKERERNINVWLPLTRPLLGTWPAIQACALTRNRTGDPLVRKLTLNPLSHTSRGRFPLVFFLIILSAIDDHYQKLFH